MKIEHVAFQVPDPVAQARWLVEHLGMAIIRAQAEPPFGHFLADDSGAVMVELYQNPVATTPDYWEIDPVVLHLAFVVAEVDPVCDRLVAAGATLASPPRRGETGDVIAMLRDPWGLTIQLVSRAEPMLR